MAIPFKENMTYEMIDISSCGDIKVEDIAILHLSDLHIKDTLNRTLYKLLDDIATQLQSIRKLIIVITGDLACRSDVSGSAELIEFFFKELKGHIPSTCEIVDIELTAGNHDVVRPHRSNKYNNKTYKFCDKDFRTLGERIYKIFNLNKDFRTPITIVNCGPRKICFVRVDSSWHASEEDLFRWMCDGDARNDCKKLERSYRNHARKANMVLETYTKFQTNWLKNAYDKSVGECHPELTIAFSHFPLTWLAKEGNQGVKDFLRDQGLSGVDIWMCGHTHQAQMFYNNDNNQATTMLMTGVGRPDYERTNENEKVQLQRYSLYLLSFERNTCSVQVRVSQRGGEFKVDDNFRSLYPSERGYNYSCLPLKSDVPGGYIRLNAVNPEDSKGMFVDRGLLNTLQAISVRLGFFKDLVRADINDLYLDLADLMIAQRLFKADTINKRFLLSYRNNGACFGDCWRNACTKSIIQNDLFKAFLKCLGSRIIEAFTNQYEESSGDYVTTNAFSSIGWRVNFRKYCGRLSKDKMVILEDEYVSCVSTEMDSPGKRLPWGGLLKEAAKHKDQCLVYSVANVANHIPTRWSDFLSAVPFFDDNRKTMILQRGEQSEEEIRPFLTYAISMRLSGYQASVEASKVLYILEYLKINKVVSSLVNEFLNFLDINVDEILEQI